MASWQEAVAVQPARTPRARPRPAAKPRAKTAARRKPKARTGVAGGLAWIAVAGVLLAGIVALNVAVLRLNVQLDRLNNDRAKLRAGNAALASQLASAAASPLIQSLARKRLGLVPADPATTRYVDIAPHGR